MDSNTRRVRCVPAIRLQNVSHMILLSPLQLPARVHTRATTACKLFGPIFFNILKFQPPCKKNLLHLTHTRIALYRWCATFDMKCCRIPIPFHNRSRVRVCLQVLSAEKRPLFFNLFFFNNLILRFYPYFAQKFGIFFFGVENCKIITSNGKARNVTCFRFFFCCTPL